MSRALGRAGHRAFQTRKDTAFGGHRCSWDSNLRMVRVGYWCGDNTPDSDRNTEQEEMLSTYTQVLVAAGYHVTRGDGCLYVPIEKNETRQGEQET